MRPDSGKATCGAAGLAPGGLGGRVRGRRLGLAAHPPFPLLRGKLFPGKGGPLGLGEESVGILLMCFLDFVLGWAGRLEHSGLG